MQIMAQLHRDHENLNKLLAILKRKQRKLEEGDHPNFQLMKDVMDYITQYANNHHHPLEDLIFKFMMEHHPEESDKFQAIIDEHRTLRKQTNELSDCIDHILMDAIVPMDEFADQLGQFVDKQIEHIDKEENQVFPIIDRLVDSQEWQELKEELPSQEDPLFGETVATEFQELYSELLDDQEEDEQQQAI